MKNKIIIAPSVLSANFVDLRKDLNKCVDSGIDMIHYDVMDFDFVPNLTFGSKILQDIKNNFDFKIDIHFMVKVKTDFFSSFFDEYVICNPDFMTMHIESMNKEQVEQFLNVCKDNNIGASLAISPDTNVKSIEKYLHILKNVLVMSVHPGFGGQSFIENSLEKIKTLKKLKIENNYKYSIEVDGGINEKTAQQVIQAGAEIIVAGSYLFEAENFRENLGKINV